MSFNTLIVIGMFAVCVLAGMYSGWLSRESDEERARALKRESAVHERAKEMAKCAALTGAKLASQALMKLLNK